MQKVSSIILFTFLFTLPSSLSATTYLWFWVNGDTAHVLTQGDTLVWELDVASPGNKVLIELYLDMDGSEDISDGDIFLEQFTMTDGDPSQDGPSDSSSTPDGMLNVYIGPFGFAPQNYLMKIIDEDESTVTEWFSMQSLLDPPATVSGRVYIEGVSAPDPLFEYIMIGAMGQNGLFSGFTDSNGVYTINLPVPDASWEVGPFLEASLPGYISNNEGYEIVVPAGNTDSINFYYEVPKAWVYGNLIDQDGVVITRDGYVGLENTTIDQSTDAPLENGHFNLPAIVRAQGSDSTNFFRLRIQNEVLIPDYMVPNDYHEFPVSIGDSIERNIVAFATDVKIFGFVTENSNSPSKRYAISANSDSFGNTETMSDLETGFFELFVRKGSEYHVGLQDDPDWGTPPPPGMILENGNWFLAIPGDTVYFNFIPAQAGLSGTISFDQGDPIEFNYDHNRVTAWDSSFSMNYGTRVDESNSYNILVPNGKFSVNFDPESNKYLTMPSEYSNISVQQDTVDTLDFLLNYAHANITVKFIAASFPPYFDGYSINSEGQWPDVYSTNWQEVGPDSTVRFDICEGVWRLNAPFYMQNFEVFPEETLLVVTEQDSSFYVEFVYKDLTAFTKKSIYPATYYLNQNYPNPFNPETKIEYGLPKTSHVSLIIYNILGEKVAELVNSKESAGRYKLNWKPGNIASGLYIYRLEADGVVLSRKMLFIK